MFYLKPHYITKTWLLICGLIITLTIISCNKIGVFEKNTTIPNYKWQNTFKPSYSFTITDTTALYNIYLVIRHTDAYKYNNVWVNITTQFPTEVAKQQRLEIILGNDAQGWEGTGMDDIWELRKPITMGPVPLKKAGLYTFSIEQIMRENPLQHVLSAGIRVEKVIK